MNKKECMYSCQHFRAAMSVCPSSICMFLFKQTKKNCCIKSFLGFFIFYFLFLSEQMYHYRTVKSKKQKLVTFKLQSGIDSRYDLTHDRFCSGYDFITIFVFTERPILTKFIDPLFVSFFSYCHLLD